ncbi:MAG: DUF2460 domain-containing protein [Sinimarinibacterium sp.]|jgi:uncharacterized protein (TIGR02217 family)
MALLTVPFPRAISFGFEGGAGYDTNIVIDGGGNEFRNQNRENALREFDVAHMARLPAVYKPLIKFFHAAGGMANTFACRDWSDFEVASGEGIFAALGGGVYQFQKQYVEGGITRVRNIMLPLADGLVITGSTGGTVDHSLGRLSGGSGTPTAWTGLYDCLCRFGTDKMRGSIFDKSGGELVYRWQSIPIVEVKEAD